MNRMTWLVLMLTTLSFGLAAIGCDKKEQEEKPLTTAQVQYLQRDLGAGMPFDPAPPPVPMVAYSPKMDETLPADMIGVRAQPAVFRIICYGDVDLRVPKDVVVRTVELEAEWKQQSAVSPTNVTQQNARFFWSRIITNPEKYLTVKAETAVRQRNNVSMGGGTGFLVSREGIVVTNAHVVSDCGPEPVPDDPEVMVGLLGGEVAGWIKNFTTTLGGAPSADQEEALAKALLVWMRNHSSLTGKFKEAKLAMSYAKKDIDPMQRSKMTLDQILNRPAEPIVAPLKILAKGERMPGNDVAILKAEKGDWDPVDRAICLPLGNSDDVLPATRVLALGFPKVSFNPNIMTPDAEYRVTIQDGQVGNTKTMIGGWNAFEMTADINHGDSGGPVIDPKGRVIAINVGSANNASGHTLAVPIDLAQRMLKELKITPDPGPLTALWIGALNDYHQGKYAEAKVKLDLIQDIQAYLRAPDGTQPPLTNRLGTMLSEKANPYVRAMQGRVFSKLHPRQNG